MPRHRRGNCGVHNIPDTPGDRGSNDLHGKKSKKGGSTLERKESKKIDINLGMKIGDGDW